VALLSIIIVVGLVLDVFSLAGLVGVLDDLPNVSTTTRILAGGTSTVGLGGFVVSWLSSGAIQGLRIFGMFDGGNGRGVDVFKLIAIVVGLVMVYYHIYGRVREQVRATISTGTSIILDVQGERPGGDRAAAAGEATRVPEAVPEVD